MNYVDYCCYCIYTVFMPFVYKNCTENLSLHVRVIKYALIKYWIYSPYVPLLLLQRKNVKQHNFPFSYDTKRLNIQGFHASG